MTIQEINHLDRESFSAAIGPVFENSSWIANEAWPRRPFANRGELLAALIATVEQAGTEPLMRLILAHPDLGGRLAQQGLLSRESGEEQRAAGIDGLDGGSRATLGDLNAQYREKFGFPFIICAKLNSPETILAGMRQRLEGSLDEEVMRAWEEIKKIASLRLDAIVD